MLQEVDMKLERFVDRSLAALEARSSLGQSPSQSRENKAMELYSNLQVVAHCIVSGLLCGCCVVFGLLCG